MGNQINAAVGNWSARRTTWIADAHRDGKRFVVRAEEKVIAFLRLEAVIRVTSLELCFLRNCSQQLNLRRSTPTANSAEPSNSNVEPVSGTEAGCFI